jgi:regulator of sirC expression with transglutaminase-like and TPR domain
MGRVASLAGARAVSAESGLRLTLTLTHLRKQLARSFLTASACSVGLLLERRLKAKLRRSPSPIRAKQRELLQGTRTRTRCHKGSFARNSSSSFIRCKSWQTASHRSTRLP